MPDPLLVWRDMRLDPQAFASEANRTRTPGIHLTDVLRDMHSVANGGKSEYAIERTVEDLNDYAVQGYLWEEEVMTGRLRHKVRAMDGGIVRLDPFVVLPEFAVSLDGSWACPLWSDREVTGSYGTTPYNAENVIIMTPDGGIGSEASDIQALVEVKWLTKSASMFDMQKARPLWYPQVKSYLFGLSIWLRRLLTDVYWHVQFACGTYKGDPPIYREAFRSFSREEIWAQWESVVAHVRWRTGEKDGRGGGEDPHGWGDYLR